MKRSGHLRFGLFLLAMVFSLPCFGQPVTKKENDWNLFWQKRAMPPMPKAVSVHIDTLGELGKDLENREWRMIPTAYHQIHFQPSTDPNKLFEIYARIDNLYEFLQRRSPAKTEFPRIPIRTFLVPDQRGRSRCCWNANAMRTGDLGDFVFNLSSLLHEETHLFNMAYLVDQSQGWWTGEYFCQYYQRRAELTAQKKNIRKEMYSKMTAGPQCRISEIDSAGKKTFDEAFAALYFLEEKYGPDKLNEFRHLCLLHSKTKGGNLPESLFEKAFGKKMAVLEKEWLAFYRWETVQSTSTSPEDERLLKPVSYATDQESVQYVVMGLVQQAGLGYDFNKSLEQTKPYCQRWVRDVTIQNVPLNRALAQILDPVGLTYKIENNTLVLYKKQGTH